MKYVDPDGKSEEDYSSIKMGGYKLKSSQLFDYMVETVTNCGLMGKEYSTDSNNPYVCTTFVSDVLDLISTSKGDYLPGGQKVIDSILKIDDKFESNGTNPSEGTYIFYFDYGDGTGHTGFVNFDKEGNATILHNGSDGNGNSCVNVRTRDSRDFKTWFTNNNSGTLYYKKLELDIWIE